MFPHVLDRVRQLALALSDVAKRASHRAPCFYVRNKPICRFHDVDFAGEGQISLWWPAPSGVREVIEDAFRLQAPKTLLVKLDQ